MAHHRFSFIHSAQPTRCPQLARCATIGGIALVMLQACASHAVSSTTTARQLAGPTPAANEAAPTSHNHAIAPWRFSAAMYEQHLAPWVNTIVTASNFSASWQRNIVRQPSFDPFFDILLRRDGVLSPIRMCFAGLGQCAQP